MTVLIRSSLVAYLLLVAFGFFSFTCQAGRSLLLSCSTKQVGKYQKIEFTIQTEDVWTNPFNPQEIDLQLALTAPGGNQLTLPAFWYQPYERLPDGAGAGTGNWMYPSGVPGWLARFAPLEIGTYHALAVLKDARGTIQSQAITFRSVPSESKGFLRVSRRDSRFFEYSEGQPLFAIGQNLAFIGSQQYVTFSKAEQIFGELAANGANYLRIWACCDDWAMAIEARKSAFGRSWDWHPPIVPIPGERSDRKCLKLSGAHRGLAIDPSHPLAVRPATRYLLSGKVLLQPDNRLEVDFDAKETPVVLRPGERGGWQDFQCVFQTSSNQFWVGPMQRSSAGSNETLVAGLSLREANGGPELLWEADVNRPVLGVYNPLDCFMLDELVSAAERNAIVLQLCLLTRDLYMHRLKDPASPEYDRAIHDARNTLRYAVARWGYSTSVAAWEYWNEMDPRLPTDRFYAELGAYLEKVDPYRHLRTTSTWGPSAKDCQHPELDAADVHFYLRPVDKGRLQDEVDAVLERSSWLRRQAPAKPAHLGEFGLANDKWQPTEEMKRSRQIVDFHNALWASALSGASGTAMFWWWDRLDERGSYSEYRPVSRFVSDVPWTSGDVHSAEVTCSEPRVRPVALQARDSVWLWLFNSEASWGNTVVEQRAPAQISGATLQLKGLSEGAYSISWYDTRLGREVNQQRGATETGILRMPVPMFVRDLACKVTRVSN